MKEAPVMTRSERAPIPPHQAPLTTGPVPPPAPGLSEPTASLLSTLERNIDRELGPLREGVEPALAELRECLVALYPAAGGRHPPPAQQEEYRVRVAGLMDFLEDNLEALQRAARARRLPDASGRGV